MGLTTEPSNIVIHSKNVRMPVKDSTTYFANLQGKSPQRNFTSKSSDIKIKLSHLADLFTVCSQLCAKPAGIARLFMPVGFRVPKLLQEGAESRSTGKRAVCCFPNCSGSWKATRLQGGVTRMMQRLTKSHNIVVPTKGPKPVLLIRLAESAREDER